ncbi:MAG: NADH:ubiquinone oxidoreductase subunit RnfG [Desulfuromonas sp.]|nr:MAG: NADH:ubiquinone oxidoreductase subunit RnfG [Desulfuromonas sp.]
MKDILRLVVALTLITVGAGFVLSMVESVTREPIAEQRRLEMMRALEAVLPGMEIDPEADSVELVTGTDRKGRDVIRTFYRGRRQQELAGIAFSVVAPDGYSGNIAIMVGIDPEGSVAGIEILSHAETPGLGDKITHEAFKGQFKQKSLDNAEWRVKKDGGEFDQITGATISPRAVVKAVKSGLEFFREHRQEIVE